MQWVDKISDIRLLGEKKVYYYSHKYFHSNDEQISRAAVFKRHKTTVLHIEDHYRTRLIISTIFPSFARLMCPLESVDLKKILDSSPIFEYILVYKPVDDEVLQKISDKAKHIIIPESASRTFIEDNIQKIYTICVGPIIGVVWMVFMI